MRYIVDQISDTVVTCEVEDKTLRTFPKDSFPMQLQVGDVVKEENGSYIILEEETKQRKEKIRKLMSSLWE